jgi:hypothetical protein
VVDADTQTVQATDLHRIMLYATDDSIPLTLLDGRIPVEQIFAVSPLGGDDGVRRLLDMVVAAVIQ